MLSPKGGKALARAVRERCSGAKASADSRGACTGRAAEAVRDGRDRRHHSRLQGPAADAPLHRQRAAKRAGRALRDRRRRRCEPRPRHHRAISTSSPRSGASRSCATRAISASCSRSTAAWRCIPTATWCCSTATPRWRTTGSTACCAPPTPIRTSARSRRSPTTPRSARIRSKAGRGACPERSGSPRSIVSSRRPTPGRTVDLPTAVGFCMCIRRACLDQVGLFDAERFGRGYGEENDFCMRAAGAGWRNVLAGDVFVYHEGAVSFSGERLALTETAGKTLASSIPTTCEGARVRAHTIRRARCARPSTARASRIGPKSFGMCSPSASRSAR